MRTSHLVGLSTDTTSCSVVINQDISSQTQKNKWISCEVWEKLILLQCISNSKILTFSWKIWNNKVCPLFICCCREDFPVMLQSRGGFKMKMCYFSKNTPLVGGVEVLCRRWMTWTGWIIHVVILLVDFWCSHEPPKKLNFCSLCGSGLAALTVQRMLILVSSEQQWFCGILFMMGKFNLGRSHRNENY